MRSELRAPPPGAAGLAQASQTGVRPRPGTLPKLRRRAEDHCGDPEAAGDGEDPHAPGVVGTCATTLSCSRSSAARGLTIPIHRCSGGSALRAAGVGCVRVVAGPMKAAWRPGVTRKWNPERRFSAGPSTPNGSPPASKDRLKRVGHCAPPLLCNVHGDVGKKKTFLTMKNVQLAQVVAHSMSQ